MRTLLRYLSPFAPDLAGATSALFELDGLIVICDAGGCTGNICGFDEPRWFTRKSALFSAGLRDMDAILGRDRELADKLIDAAKVADRRFMAMIGSPVPAVIATDFNALKHMCSKKLDTPVLAVEASGTAYYEVGASQAYCELFKSFAVEKLPVRKAVTGVLGATPLDYSSLHAAGKIAGYIDGEVRVYGMNGTLEDVIKASEVEKNIVVSPSGLKCAKYLERTFGTPYECCAVAAADDLQLPDLSNKKVLVVHQNFAAAEVKKLILEKSSTAEVFCGSFFFALNKDVDYKFASEGDFRTLFENNQFDVVIADNAFKRIVQDIFTGVWIDYPHFAVSGRLLEEL